MIGAKSSIGLSIVETYVTLREEWPVEMQAFVPVSFTARGHRHAHGKMEWQYFETSDAALDWCDLAHATNTARKKFWRCECCASLIACNPQDDASRYQCPQCTIVKCSHGGKYREISEADFLRACGLTATHSHR